MSIRGLFGGRSTAPSATAALRERVATIDAEGFDPDTIGQDAFLRRELSQDFGPPVRFLTEDTRVVEPYYVSWQSNIGGPSGDIGCYVLNDVAYDPAVFAALDRDGAVLIADNVMPRYWQQALARGKLHVGRNHEQIVEGICVACLPPYIKSYGHFLLETLPRLWLLRAMVGAGWAKLRFLVDDQCPAWSRKLLEVAGVEGRQCVVVRRGRGRLRVAKLLLPGPMHSDFRFHPGAMGHYDRVEGAARAPTPSKLYVPRGPADERRFVNEPDIIAWVEAQGFTVVEPWTLPWLEQVTLFRGAKLIMGAYGSALHSAVFAPSEAQIIAFGFVNHIQACIATARQQGFCLVRPSRDERRDDGYIFEMSRDAISGALEAARAA